MLDDIEWSDIFRIIIALILVIIPTFFLSNNYIEYKEYDKQMDKYATMYPPTKAMYNGVQYTCEFTQEPPKINFSRAIHWNYWYIYPIVAVIVIAIALMIFGITGYGFSHMDP